VTHRRLNHLCREEHSLGRNNAGRPSGFNYKIQLNPGKRFTVPPLY